MFGINTEKVFKILPFTQVCTAIHGKEKAVEMCRDDKYDWKTEVVNGVSIFMVPFLTTLIIYVERIPIDDIEKGVLIGAATGGVAFFTRLGIKRKHIKKR